MSVKEIIKKRRLELGLTMKEVADIVGVSEGTISRWESGEIENMRRDKILALAKALHISPAVLMEWDTKEKEEYYIDPETVELANRLKENPGLRLLFDAGKDMPPEDILKTLDFINANLQKD